MIFYDCMVVLVIRAAKRTGIVLVIDTNRWGDVYICACGCVCNVSEMLFQLAWLDAFRSGANRQPCPNGEDSTSSPWRGCHCRFRLRVFLNGFNKCVNRKVLRAQDGNISICVVPDTLSDLYAPYNRIDQNGSPNGQITNFERAIKTR